MDVATLASPASPPAPLHWGRLPGAPGHGLVFRVPPLGRPGAYVLLRPVAREGGFPQTTSGLD
eukprot:2005194-Alexandrium_andersonii.AAC.1